MGKDKKKIIYAIMAILALASILIYAFMTKNNWLPKSTGMISLSEKIQEEEKKDQPSPDATEPANEPAVPRIDGGKDQPDPRIKNDSAATNRYPLHKNVSTTYFWIGEDADDDNGNISNFPSAWDEDWVKHFGGVDYPNKRNGYLPAGFTPKENPFYFALPYNDFDGDGNQKNDPEAIAIWAKNKKFGATESLCKNQWVRIIKNGKTAYAQWEDVGPFGENDKAYVFGNKLPKSKKNSHAGLDVSPAVRDYLGLDDIDKTDWQFVDTKDVPDGPWKNIVTTSQINWK